MRNLLNKLKGKKINKKLISIMLSVLIAFTFTAGYFISVVNASTIEVSNLQIGDTITLGRVGDLDLVWRVVGFDNDGEIYKTGTNPYVVLDNWTDLTYYKGLQFDFPHTGDSYSYYNTYGSNDWQESALRKLLNSTEDAAHVDYTDTYYSGSGYNLNGFLHDFTSEEVDLIKDTTHIYAVNGNIRGKIGINDMPYDEHSNEDYRTMSKCQFIGYNNLLNTYYHKESTEKVFLMSYYEYGQAQQKGSSGGFVWSDKTTDGKHYFLLRDASTHFLMDYTHGVRWVHYNKITAHNSDINGNNVANHYIEELDSNVSDENTYIRPACVLDGSKTLSVRSEGDYYVPKPSLEDATIEGFQNEILYDGTDKKQSGYTVKYNGNSLVEATWNSNLYANELNIGDVVNLGRLGDTELQWLVVGYGPDCESDRSKGAPFLVLNNWTSTDLNSYHGMAFDLPHSGSSDNNEKSSGSNEWGNSTLRTWLNSDKAASEIDYSHPNYTGGDPYSKNGFLHDFTTLEKSALAVTNHKYIVSGGHGYDEGNHTMATNNGAPSVAFGSLYDTAYSKYSEDYVFPLSIKELVNAANNAYTKGFSWKPSTYTYFLRDANAATLSAVRKVDTTEVGTTAANPSSGLSNFALRPAIILKKDTRIIKLGNSSYGFEYELGQITSGDYFVTYQGDTRGPGEIKMTLNGIGNYEGTKVLTYDIVKKSIEGAEIEGFEDLFQYDGTIKKQNGITVTLEGETLEKVQTDADVSVSKLELGDVVKLGRLGDAELEWIVIGFGPDCIGDKSAGAPYLCLFNWNKEELYPYKGMVYDAPHNGDPNDDGDMQNRNLNGSNNWKTSTIRTWLNSDKEANYIDYTHDYYTGNPYWGKDGFLSDFTESEKSMIAYTTHRTIINGNVDTPDGGESNLNVAFAPPTTAVIGWDDAYYQETTDQVFFMSIKEVYNAALCSAESKWAYNPHEYSWFLRDATTNTVSAVRYNYSSDSSNSIDSKAAIIDLSNSSVINNMALRPAIILTEDAEFKLAGTSRNDTPLYEMGTETSGDYAVSYVGNTKGPGEVTVKISGRGLYGGTITRTYDIIKRSMDYVEVKGIENKFFDGTPKLQTNYVLEDDNGTILTGSSNSGDTLPSELNIGDVVKLGKLGGVELEWLVLGFGPNCEADKSKGMPYLTLRNWTDSGLSNYRQMAFDVTRQNDSITSRNQYGSNEWSSSTIRTWLNSDQKEYLIPYTHRYDNNNPYPGKNGFLFEFSNDEKNAIAETTHKNVVSELDSHVGGTAYHTTVLDVPSAALSNWDTAYYQETTDKVFLMNIKELYNAANNSSLSLFAYTNTNYGYYLRDFSRTLATSPVYSYVRYIKKNDSRVYQKYANSPGADSDTTLLRPALILSEDALFEYVGEAATGKSYKLGEKVLGDFEVSYMGDTTGPGEVTITFTGTGNYEGIIEITYNIIQCDFDEVEVKGIVDKTYDGTPKLQSGYTVTVADEDGHKFTLKEVIGDGDTDASKLEIGDLVTLGRLNNHPLIWRVVGFDEDCNASGSDPYLVLENWMDTEFDKYAGIDTNQVMAFDAAHTGDTSSNRNSNGSNYWDTSTLKTWLNSNQTYDKIDYTHEYYTAGNPYGERDGFLHEFNEDEINSIKEVTHKNIIHEQDIALKDGGSANYTKTGETPQTIVDNYDTAYFKNTTEKVFCMNIKEIKNAITNDTNFVYYESGRYYWLRDAAFSGPQKVFYIHHSGKVWANDAYETGFFRLRPAVILKHDAALKTLSSSADSDYEVTSPARGDFKVSYTGDLIGPGEVTMTFTGYGGTPWTVSKTYNITQKQLADATVTGIEDTLYYDGTPKKQSGYVLKDKDGNTLTEVLGDGDTDATKLKLGDIVTLGKLGGHPLKWRVVGFDEDCLETGTNPYLVLENYTDTELSAYTGFEFDPKHDDTDSAVYARDGYNNWSASTLRKWYNSSDTTIDYSHDHYANVDPYGKPGFLHEFEDYEAGAIKPVTHKYVVESFEEHGSNGTEIHTWKDNKRLSDTGSDHPLQNYENAYYQTCEDKVFASNILEISNAYKWKGTSGYEYSGGAVYWLRDELCYGSGTLTYSQTRAVLKPYTGSVEGIVGGYNPYTEGTYLSLRPALVLKAETSLKTLESGKYQVAQPGVGEYTVSYSRTNGDSSDLTSPGEIKITFTGAGSYGGTKTFTYNIVKKSMDDVEVAPLTDFVYNGGSQLQSSFSLKYKDETPLVQKTSDADSTISNLKLGDIVSLGKLGDTKLLWRVVGFGVNCESDSSKGAPYLVLENWKDSSLSSYRGMIFDPKHDATDTSDRNNWGSNNWETSTIRKWLNSDVKASDIDYTHTHYTSGTDPYNKDGFLYGFTQSEKDAIASVTHKNLVRSSESNTPDRHDGGSTNLGYNYQIPACVNGYDDAYYQNTTDKIFFMNMKELCNAINNKDASGFVYCDSNSLKYIYFLRDAEAQYEYNFRDVFYNGNISSAAAYNVYSDGCLRPAIILSEDAGLKACDIASDSCNFKIAETIDGDFTVSYSSDTTNVGEVTVTFTGCGSYEGTITATYNILSNEIDTDDITVEVSDEITYTGSAIELSADDITVKVKSGGEFVAIDSSNYTITGYSEDHTNAGNASVTIKLSGIFDSDPVTKNFTIHQVDITNNDDVTMPNLQQNLVYTGEALTPTGMAVKWKETTLTNNVDYNASPANNTNAGDGNVIVIAKGNFTGTKTFNFPIAKKDISSNDKITISTITDKEKTGSQIQPEFKIYDGDILFAGSPKELTAWSDYTISYGENKEVGEGTITITGDGNYTGSKTFTFNIVGRKVNASEISFEINDATLVYDGTNKEPTFNVLLGDTTLTKDVDYDFVKYANNLNATDETSKAEVVIRLKGDYSCESDITGYFDINPLDMTNNSDITMPNVNADNFKYTGSSLTPSDMTVKWNSNTLTDNDYTISVTDNVDAGTAKVTVTGKNNFTGSKVFNFTIGKRSFEDDTIEYFVPDEEYQSGVQIKPTSFTVKDSTIDRNLVLGTDYSIDPDGYGANNAKGDNSGSITITGGGNFEGTKVLYFNIVGAKINDLSKITATLDDSNLIYTGDALTPSDKITVSLDGVGVLTSDDWEVVSASWTNNTNAGNASVKVKLKGNYSSDPVTINFTIKQKELDITDFAFSGSDVATKEVTLKSEYSDVVPTSEMAKLVVKYGDVVLNFTSAKFKGISASDNPMKFGNCAITLSGLSLSDTNYKLKDTFTSFEVDSTHGLIVDKIKPELLSAFVTILDGTYKTGDMIYIELNYDKDISLNGNDPKLEFYSNVLSDGKIGTLETNKYKVQALYDSISGNKVKFKYEVKEGDYLPSGFTFALSGIINFESLVDSNGNAVNYSNETKRFDNVIVLSKSGVFDEIKKLIEGNDTNKESKILDILKDDDKTDLIFDTEPDLKSKIGSGASNDDARRKAAEYLAKSDDLDLSDITKLIDEIKRALHAKELEDEIKAKLDSQTPPTKEEIDDMMIKYQKLSSNEKKVFDSNLKTRLEELYYANLTADWKYKDSPSGEANEIEMYGIVSRTSAAIGKAVKLKVERIYDNARINELQGMVEANPGSTGERIIAPYDINLVDSDDVPVTIPGENVLCKIELPVGYYGKVINIYHKVDDTHIETVQNKLIQKIGDKCLVYFDCNSFSPYFMTSDAVSVKASLDPESTEGTVSPLGLFTVNQGENKDFIFTKSGETNRVDITLSKFNNQTKTFDLISGIDPINLFNTSKYTLKNITTNMFITFKLSHDDNFKKSGGSSGGGGGGGGGGSTPKSQEPVVPVPPAQPEKEFEVFNAYMQGYEDGTFGPQLNMTRAEAATIIARISEDFSEDANFKEISKSYKDYSSRHWANNYIGYVTEVGIMCGDEEGFRPDDKITRGEFSKLIYKLLNLENANLAIVKTFDDCKGQFYETYANALYSAGILTGYEDGTFNGSGKLTRTEAAIMINKATGRGLDKEETLKAIKESENFKEFKDVASNRWFYFDDMMATVSYSLEKETDQTLVDNPKKD